MHQRNKHKGHYHFEQLLQSCPELKSYIAKNPKNELTIDFSNPKAVKTLNRALLMDFYGLTYWDLPENYLCPPVPGRSDYIHHLADLLGKPKTARILDVGVGASCIYPIIGHCEYGWDFVGTDIDSTVIESAQKIVDSNKKLSRGIELRLQNNKKNIFKDVIEADEKFDAVICNPPFHASAEEAQESSERKWKNLGHKKRGAHLNFGGQSNELWYPGGELGFVKKIIAESVLVKDNMTWFTTLVSKESNLLVIYRELNKVKVLKTKTIDMSQGQKKSRIVAWTFKKVV